MTRSDPLATIERTTLVLAVAATAGAGLIWGAAGMGAAGLGAALACANLYVMRRTAWKAIVRVLAGDTSAAGRLGVVMMLKMLVLFGALWVAVAVIGVPVAPFALGLSVLVASLIGSGLWTALRGDAV